MKHQLKILSALLVLVSTILLFTGLVIRTIDNYKHNVDRDHLLSASDSEAEANEYVPLIFESIEEYRSYIFAEYSKNMQDNNVDAESHYYMPTNLMDGVTIKSIEITQDGTVFTYDITGITNRDSWMEINTDDETLLELISVARQKVYTSQYITDAATYASRLATAVGATPISGFTNYYWGTVTVDIEQSNGTYASTAVARQMVFINSNGYVQYNYYPVTITQDTFDDICDLQYVSICSTDVDSE